MKHCILATDLALFFPNKARLANIIKENSFSWDIPDHRYDLQPSMGHSKLFFIFFATFQAILSSMR
jgi:hypothetical protein